MKKLIFKKIMYLSLVVALLLAMPGCGKSEKPEQPETPSAQVQAPSGEETTAPQGTIQPTESVAETQTETPSETIPETETETETETEPEQIPMTLEQELLKARGISFDKSSYKTFVGPEGVLNLETVFYDVNPLMFGASTKSIFVSNGKIYQYCLKSPLPDGQNYREVGTLTRADRPMKLSGGLGYYGEEFRAVYPGGIQFECEASTNDGPYTVKESKYNGILIDHAWRYNDDGTELIEDVGFCDRIDLYVLGDGIGVNYGFLTYVDGKLEVASRREILNERTGRHSTDLDDGYIIYDGIDDSALEDGEKIICIVDYDYKKILVTDRAFYHISLVFDYDTVPYEQRTTNDDGTKPKYVPRFGEGHRYKLVKLELLSKYYDDVLTFTHEHLITSDHKLLPMGEIWKIEESIQASKPQEPVTEEPTTVEPTTAEPTTQEPVTEQPTTVPEPTTEEPTTAAVVENVNITKTAAMSTETELYENSDFSMQIPKGWKVIIGSSGLYKAIRVQDPSQPLNQIFVLLKAKGLLHSQAGKDAWAFCSTMGVSGADFLSKAPVLDPATTENYFKIFAEYGAFVEQNEGTYEGFSFPRFEGFNVVERFASNSSLAGSALDEAVLRATFAENGAEGEGMFATTVVDFGSVPIMSGWPNGYYVPQTDGGYYMAYCTMAVTAAKDTFIEWESVLTQCLETLSYSKSFTNDLLVVADPMSSQTNKIVNERCGIIKAAWESRNVEIDITNQVNSDRSGGYERVYNTQSGETYRAPAGWHERTGSELYKPVTDNMMFAKPISGYIE